MRILAPIAVGSAFVLALLYAILHAAMTGGMAGPDMTAARMFHKEPKELHLASDGPFGKYDREQLQRGFQVYKEVCSACHSMKLVSFADLRGLGYREAEVKAIAKNWQVQQPSISDKTGEVNSRPNIPSDHFYGPYPNETAARGANNGALPPDFSLISKAREGGAAYIYSLVTGYQNVPAEQAKMFPDSVPDNRHYYNPYFANLNIAMPPPLKSDGLVTYADGTVATKDQMAKDVAAFLTWTAEPKLENRHTAGLPSVLFLMIFSVFCYLSYRAIWAGKEH
jgi:ubiquinol-cytochrome c reductase cytochrome c1 subunit